MNARTPILVAIILIFGGLLWWLASTPERATESAITSVAVVRPNLKIVGNGLSRVEIWTIPTGTGITESDYQHLGNATLDSSDENGNQHWTFPIPTDPLLITGLYAEGFGTDSATAGKVYLTATGATELYNLLYGTTTATSTLSSDATSTASTTTERKIR